MPRSKTPHAIALAVLALGGLPIAAAAAQGDPHHGHGDQGKEAKLPASIRAEHREIHGALEAATKVTGRVGAAAKELATVLHPHFMREEQIALPPLALLAPLARGETPAGMREILPMTDSLRAEMPRMLEEHVVIRAATRNLGEVAKAEGNAAVAQLAEKLALHALSEEEILYPAAVLVGDLVRARLSHH